MEKKEHQDFGWIEEKVFDTPELEDDVLNGFNDDTRLEASSEDSSIDDDQPFSLEVECGVLYSEVDESAGTLDEYDSDAIGDDEALPFSLEVECGVLYSEEDVFNEKEETQTFSSTPFGGSSTNLRRKVQRTSQVAKSYDMHELEQLVLEKIYIRRIHDHIYYFDGHVFRPLDQRNFLRLMRASLSEEVISAVPSYTRMVEVYKYLDTNADIEMDFSEEKEICAKRFIVFGNGLYDAGQDRLLEFSNKYPVFFEIDACFLMDDHRCKTPEFDKFLGKISNGDKQIERLIMQMIGYLLLQGSEGKCFFVLGTQRNSGKSVLGEFIAALFDEDAVANLPLTTLGERFSLGSLWKKAINVSMDLPTKTLTEDDVSKIKLLTGECRINTEEKYEPVSTTFIHCKHIFATNGTISLKVEDDAFWDRLIFVPFMHSIEKNYQDKNLLNKLLQEKDGITTKAAKAVGELIRNNFHFPEPEIAKKVIDSWKAKNQGSIKAFVEACCEFGGDKAEYSEDLYEAYRKFCLENDWIAQSNNSLIRYIKLLPGITHTKKRKTSKDNPQSYIEGVHLKIKEDFKGIEMEEQDYVGNL